MCETFCQTVQKKQEEKRIEEEQVAKAQNWKLLVCCDDDDDYNFAITPNEPIDSLSIGDEHLNTISAMESDKFIKSRVENLESDSSDYQSCSDEDFPEEIFLNPLFEEEIIPMKIDQHHFDAESDLIESMLNHDSSIIPSSSKIDSLLDEFAGELTLLKSISPRIDETDCYHENDIRLIERLLYDNSSPSPPKEFVSENSDADIESFSPSPILDEDSDSRIEENDLTCTPDDLMPPSIEDDDDDDDSKRDILIHEELFDNYSLSLPEIESFYFDIPLFSRPLVKPPDGNTGILNIKMMGDISDQKLSARYSMMIHGKNIPILDVPLFLFYPLDQLNIPGNLKTLAKGFYPPSLHFLSFNWESSTSVQDHLDGFNTILIDLKNLDVDIDDEDKVVLLVISLPASYKHFKEIMLYGNRETLLVDDVKSALLSKQKYNDDVEPESGEGLVARGRSYDREDKGNNEKKPKKAAEVAIAKGDSDGDVYLAIDTKKSRDELIVDSGCTFHMIPHRSWFTTYESFNGGNVYMGNHYICPVIGKANGCKYSGEGGVMKIFKVSFSPGIHRTRDALDYIHSDLWGPSPVTSRGGKKIKKLRTDNGLEFMDKVLMPYAESATTASYLINRSPHRSLDGNIPEILWSGNSVDYSNLRVFGCPVYVHVNEGKLVPRAVKCIFLGYGSRVKAYIKNCEPTNYLEAISRPECDKWAVAMEEEVESLHKNETWELVKLPKEKRAISCKWLLKVKDGIPGAESNQYKARYVVRGFDQREGIDFNKSEEDKEDTSRVSYSSAVGSLMYAMFCTRPDLAHAVSVVSRYMHNPGKMHWEAVKCILRYLKGTSNIGLSFKKSCASPNGVVGYVDSDYAGDLDARKSLSSYIFSHYGSAISWYSSLQAITPLSTT
nr:retrovirus-related Pol polyprotein from transposon TNT 1-94 [Tanacetum cinerariifolium]